MLGPGLRRVPVPYEIRTLKRCTTVMGGYARGGRDFFFNSISWRSAGDLYMLGCVVVLVVHSTHICGTYVHVGIEGMYIRSHSVKICPKPNIR